MMVVLFMFGHGKGNRNREYSSTMVSIYILCVEEGSDPLKSTLSLSIGCVALMRVDEG